MSFTSVGITESRESIMSSCLASETPLSYVTMSLISSCASATLVTASREGLTDTDGEADGSGVALSVGNGGGASVGSGVGETEG